MVISGIILLGIGVIYSINIPLIAAGIAVLYLFLQRQNVALLGSGLSRLLGALFLYTTFLAAVSAVADLLYGDFKITFAPLLVIVLLTVSTGLYRIFFPKEKIPHAMRDSFFGRIDILSVVMALGVMAAIVLPPFMRYGVDGGILGQINANVDDSVHLAMINDRLHFQQDYYLDNSPETVRAEDKISYPATWHTANAVLIDAAAPHIDTGTQTLVAYVLSKTFWALVFVFFLIRAVLLRLEDLSYKSPAFYFGIGLMLFFSFIAAVSQFLFGFYNFMPQLIALLLLSSFVFNGVPSVQKRDLLLLGSIIVIGGGMVWFLLLPVMAAVLLILLAASFEKNIIKNTISTITQSLRVYPLLYLVLITAILQQVYVATLSSESLGFVESIILAGEVARYSQLLLVTLAVGTVAFLFLRDKKQAQDISSAAWTTALLMIFAGFVLAICLIRTSEPRYYYFKVLSAVVIVLIPFSVAGLVKLFQLLGTRVDVKTQWPIAATVLAMIIISILPSFSATGNVLLYMKGERPTTATSVDAVYKNLQNESAYPNQTTSYKIFYDHRSFPQNFINTMLVKSNQPDSPCFRETLMALINEHSAPSLATNAAKHCTAQQLAIVVPKQEYPFIKELLAKQQLAGAVTLISE